jgi:hypothetical protein
MYGRTGFVGVGKSWIPPRLSLSVPDYFVGLFFFLLSTI